MRIGEVLLVPFQGDLQGQKHQLMDRPEVDCITRKRPWEMRKEQEIPKEGAPCQRAQLGAYS